jgi:hypothetical protein
MTRKLTWLVALAAAVWIALPATAQEVCTADPGSVETETLDESGVTVSWHGSHWCLGAPGSGTYQATLEIGFEGAATLQVDGVSLRHTTPRPGGSGPEATVEVVDVSQDGDTVTVTVTGSYELVDTDEGPKANIHLTATGAATGTNGEDDPFRLGFNVHLRGESATEESAEPEPSEPGEGEAQAVARPEVMVTLIPAEEATDVGADVTIETVEGRLVIRVLVYLPGRLMIT